MRLSSFQKLSQQCFSNLFRRLFHKNQPWMRKQSLLSLHSLPVVSDHCITNMLQRKPEVPKKEKRRPKSNLKKENLISQTVDGSAACATTTISREEPSASDAKKLGISRISLVNQNTLDKWKTKRRSQRLPDTMARTNQGQSSTKHSTAKWLKSTVSSKKTLWVTGLVRDASTTTTLSESSATCATFPTLSQTECSTPKLNKDSL